MNLVLPLILFIVVVSIGLMLCSFNLRSKSISVLNFCLWLVATVAVAPWSTLAMSPPRDPDERLLWDAAIIWAIFFPLSIIAIIFSVVSKKLEQRVPKRRRRRSRRRGAETTDTSSDESGTSLHEI